MDVRIWGQGVVCFLVSQSLYERFFLVGLRQFLARVSFFESFFW